MISLPYNLGGYIRDQLDMYRRKNNIPEPKEVKELSVHRRRDTFLESEFELVKEYVITEESLKYIDLFPNLNSITFNYSYQCDPKLLQDIINSYPDLKYLGVFAQDNLQVLDVSKLTKLQDLCIESNNSLHRVIGLENLEDLYYFSFYGNVRYLNKKYICKNALTYSVNAADIYLDLLYFPTMKRIISEEPERNVEYEVCKHTISWKELIGVKSEDYSLTYTSSVAELIYNKAMNIIGKYIREEDTEEQRFAIIYAWMLKNVDYDYNGIDINNTLVENGIRQGLKGGDNGTANALLYGKCVCEGYSRTMQYLLNLVGIIALDVPCYAEEEHYNHRYNFNDKYRNTKSLEGDHSILRVVLNNRSYYNDATWDASRNKNGKPIQYFMLTKDEISKTHKLINEEMVVNNIYPCKIREELLQFGYDRISSVDLELGESKRKM